MTRKSPLYTGTKNFCLTSPAQSSTSLVERLAILVTSTSDGTTKLLGVPKLHAGTGEAAACAITEQLQQWKAAPYIIAMSFDTTAVNTWPKSGACTLLERHMQRDLLWLACRHHMLEVLLSDAFTVCLDASTGTDILLFKNFRLCWPQLHHEPDHRAADDRDVGRRRRVRPPDANNNSAT